MNAYQPSPDHDRLLVLWWHRLNQTGELVQTFGTGAQTLTLWLEHVAGPGHTLLFEADQDGIWFGFVLSTFLSGAAVALWIDPRKRQSRAAYEAVDVAYSHAFQAVPVLLGVTRQERLLRVHTHFGYTVHGPAVPGLFDGHPAWIVTLTAADYAAGRRRRLERRHGHFGTGEGERGRGRREHQHPDADGPEVVQAVGAGAEGAVCPSP